MGNDSFLTGILIACCLLLLVGIGFTWAEIAAYGSPPTAAEAREAPPAPAGEAEEAAPAGEAEEAAPAEPEGAGPQGLLDFAPTNAFAAVVPHGRKLAA